MIELENYKKQLYESPGILPRQKGEKDMRKTYEDRMDANITRKDGTGFWYEVFVNCTKCGEDEKLNTEEEVKNLFYELIDEDTRDSWDAKEIELEYTWGKETISTTIYC